MNRKKRNKKHIECGPADTIHEWATTIAFSNYYEDIIHLFDEIHEQIKEAGMDYGDWERRLSSWAKQHVGCDVPPNASLLLCGDRLIKYDSISAISGKDPSNGLIFDNAIHAYWLNDEIVHWEVREDYAYDYPDLRPC